MYSDQEPIARSDDEILKEYSSLLNRRNKFKKMILKEEWKKDFSSFKLPFEKVNSKYCDPIKEKLNARF